MIGSQYSFIQAQAIFYLTPEPVPTTIFLMQIFLEPLLAGIQHLYIVYSIHRYAIITGKAIMFTRPLWMFFFSVFALISVYVTETREIIDNFLSTHRFYLENHEVIWGCQIALKFSMLVFFTSLHAFVLRSIAKTLTDAAKFLGSLYSTENIKKRLDAILRIKRFNMALFLLQIVVPLFDLLRMSIVLLTTFYCKQCDTIRMVTTDVTIVESARIVFAAAQAIIFAIIHLVLLKIFSLSCK